jgi:hypothetical protein
VVDATGASLGHVVDLTAEADGDRLMVATLLVGPRAFLSRIGLTAKGGAGGSRPCREVSWRAVAKIDEAIRLRPDWDRESEP